MDLFSYRCRGQRHRIDYSIRFSQRSQGKQGGCQVLIDPGQHNSPIKIENTNDCLVLEIVLLGHWSLQGQCSTPKATLQ